MSAWSLSSIKLKKEAEDLASNQQKSKKTIRQPISEKQLVEEWKKYTQQKLKEGASNIGSVMELCIPQLEDETLKLVVPNGTNKVELQREGETLLPYLRKRLANDFIHMEITISQEKKEELVYTPEEKFKKLATANPSLQRLKEIFGLEH